MQTVQKDMQALRQQLRQGSIQRAYRALLNSMMALRTHFVNRFGAAAVSGLYQGYLDMTYFALFPASLKSRGLKIAIVFNYQAFRFEAWLAARNRQVQRQYWQLMQDSQWPGMRLVAPGGGIDSILEHDLVEDFDLSDQDDLAARIERGTTTFIDRIERFLWQYPQSGPPAA